MAPRQKKTSEPCTTCFPDGWEGIDKQQDLPGARVNGVGCEHGTWSRNAAPAKPDEGDGE